MSESEQAPPPRPTCIDRETSLKLWEATGGAFNGDKRKFINYTQKQDLLFQSIGFLFLLAMVVILLGTAIPLAAHTF